MKQLNNLACVLAMLAAGTTGFTACSSDDVEGGGNTSGAAGKMVKTSFALNIPYGSKSGRMTADKTQAGGNTFRGMQDMRLLAFDKDVATDNHAVKKIVLGTSNDAFESDDYRRIYRDVTIPVGTMNFLFYGKTDANFTETGDDLMNKKFDVGSIKQPEELTSDANKTTEQDNVDLSKITFNLERIHTDHFDGTAENSSAKVVADALKSVYNAETTGEGSKKWKDCDAKSTANVEKHAAALFAQFKTLTAGSAASAKAALESLKKGCGRTTDETDAAQGDDILMVVAKACNKAIKDLETCTFPNDLGLPDGAAKGSFNNEGVFTYNQKGIGTTDNELDYTKVTYPAALNYFVKTPVKANDDVIDNLKSSNGWPSYTEWTKSDYTWADTWKNAVGNNTRTIALQKAIQYAVASLETNVSFSAANLQDNAQKVGKLLQDQTINVSTQGFQLTGVLIGGQPSKVGWDYTATSLSTADAATFDYTVYDHVMNEKDKSITYGTTTTNYTLVLDNSQNGDGNKSVYVTLELVNQTGTDFYGADGLVPAGSKFYLIGQLNPGENGNAGTNTNNLKQVFKADYKTIANMKIGQKSLQKAYNTIPDLRSTQISLGLAVDLKWENGITFNVDL